MAAGPGTALASTDLFAESLQRLQGLHEELLSGLTTENARLREEVDILRTAAKGASRGLMDGPCEEDPMSQMPETLQITPKPSWRRPRKLQTEVSKQSSRSKDPVVSVGLSADLSKTITQHLMMHRSERSAMVWIQRVQTCVGSDLLDEYSTYRQRTRDLESSGRVSKLVSSPKFDTFTGAIVLLNAVTVGLEASLTRAGQDIPLALRVSEYVFLFLYTVEVSLRFWALGRRALGTAWVLFDIVLVCCGCFDVVTGILGHSVAHLDNVMLARTFRLIRLARVLRLVKFHTLWMLVHGLVNSLLTLTWTCIIICILLFIFAVLGLELLQPDPLASKEYNRVASENFGSLFRATATLLQGMTLDSFAVIYRPVVIEKPLTIFYFVPFLLVVSIALMNLVTALMVNFSLEQAAKDKQAEELAQAQAKEEVIGILERAFAELDTLRSGRINLQEMLEAPVELRTLICQVADVDTGDTEIGCIFRTLDLDNTGYLKIEDFCQGLLMLHDRKALESYFVLKRCSSIISMLKFRQKSGESD